MIKQIPFDEMLDLIPAPLRETIIASGLLDDVYHSIVMTYELKDGGHVDVNFEAIGAGYDIDLVESLLPADRIPVVWARTQDGTGIDWMMTRQLDQEPDQERVVKLVEEDINNRLSKYASYGHPN